MVVWKIMRIPTNGGQASADLYTFIRQILFSTQSLKETSFCLELAFLHTTGEEVSAYIIARNTVFEGIAPVVEMQLSTANYQIKRLNAEASAALSQQMLGMASADMNAVIKTEKIVTTPYMQEGYYYWADPLLSDKSCSFDNFTTIFQALKSATIRLCLFNLFRLQLRTMSQMYCST